jgi:hypothetical protein
MSPGGLDSGPLEPLAPPAEPEQAAGAARPGVVVAAPAAETDVVDRGADPAPRRAGLLEHEAQARATSSSAADRLTRVFVGTVVIVGFRIGFWIVGL